MHFSQVSPYKTGEMRNKKGFPNAFSDPLTVHGTEILHSWVAEVSGHSANGSIMLCSTALQHGAPLAKLRGSVSWPGSIGVLIIGPVAA